MKEAYQSTLFFASFTCLMLFGYMCSMGIMHKSLPQGLASLVWLVLATLFTQSRKNLSWLR